MVLRPNLVAKGKQILDFKYLRFFNPRVKGDIVFTCQVGSEHCFNLSGRRWNEMSTNNNTPIQAAVAYQRWAERKESLWWSALGHPSMGKRTIRSYAARRLRNAFTESLRKQGYAPDGSPLPGMEGRAPLFGTVQFGALPAILKIEKDALEEQMDKTLVDLLNSNFGAWKNRNRVMREGPKKQLMDEKSPLVRSIRM